MGILRLLVQQMEHLCCNNQIKQHKNKKIDSIRQYSLFYFFQMFFVISQEKYIFAFMNVFQLFEKTTN
jgi:hypothetical protein